MRCFLLIVATLFIFVSARIEGVHTAGQAFRETTSRSRKIAGLDALKRLVRRIPVPEIEAVDERPNSLSMETIRNETLLGARTMLRYHHVLMVSSFLSRFIFSLFLRLAPNRQIYNAMLGLGGVADASMKVNIFHKMATMARFILYCISEVLGGRMTHKRTLKKMYEDFSQQHGFVQGNFIYPIMEELTFRGCAQGLTHSLLSKVGISSLSAARFSQLLGAVFFSMAHSAAVGDVVSFALIAQRFAGSFFTSLFLLGRLANRRRCVWTSIGAHVFWNIFAEWPTTDALIGIGIDALLSPVGNIPKQLFRFVFYFFLHVLSLDVFRAFLGMEQMISSTTLSKAKKNLASLLTSRQAKL